MHPLHLRKFMRGLLLLASLFLLHTVFAQSIPVKGKVSDDNGQSLAGVTVSVKGARGGVVTAADGSFSITVPNSKATLSLSYVGFQTQQIVVPTAGGTACRSLT